MKTLPVKKMKFELQLFFVLFALMTLAGAWVFYNHFYQFDKKIYEKSQYNIKVLDSLTRIQDAVREQNEMLVVHEFKTLEQYNDQIFSDGNDSTNLRQLFNTVWQSTEAWFESALMGEATEDSFSAVVNDLDQLAGAYSGFFWNSAQNDRGWFGRASQDFVILMGVGFSVLVLLALVTSVKMWRYFRMQQRREDLLSVVGTRDFVTGFFNRNSFDSLALQEMSRAKRRGYGFSVLLVKIERYEQIVADFGALAGDRLLFQISEVIKSFRRSYDGIFKYSENCFAVVLVEVDREKMRSIETRLNEKFADKSFTITHDLVSVVPSIMVGFSVYPHDGQELQTLMHIAETRFHGRSAGAQETNKEPVEAARGFFEGAQALSTDSSTSFAVRAAQSGTLAPPDVSAKTVPLKQQEQETIPAKPVFREERPERRIPQSFDSIIDKYADHDQEVLKSDDGEIELNNEYLVLVAENQPPKESYATETAKIENMPDVVLALTQDEALLKKLSQESLDKKRQLEEKITRESTASETPYSLGGMTEQIVNNITKQYARTGEANGFLSDSNLPQIEIIKNDEQEDIIMVDFDREKDDLAEKFRRRLKAQKEL